MEVPYQDKNDVKSDDSRGWEDDEEGFNWEDGDLNPVIENEGEGRWGRTSSGEDDSDVEASQERLWLGDSGEIIVELPKEDDMEEDGLDSVNEGERGAAGGVKKGTGAGKGKGKAKSRRFSKEERGKAMALHTTHLAALVARCVMVNKWAGDESVQAAVLSCLPADLAPQILPEHPGRTPAHTLNKLKHLVAWFRDLVVVMDDGSAGTTGGLDGGAGSRPERLVRVLEQRVGSAQEAVQLARYVSCLDPIPPIPSNNRLVVQTRRNTVDLTRSSQSCSRGQSRGWGRSRGVMKGPGLCSSAWAEVLVCEGPCEGELGLDVPLPSPSAPRPKRQRVQDASPAAVNRTNKPQGLLAQEEEASSSSDCHLKEGIGCGGMRGGGGDGVGCSGHMQLRWVHVDPVQGEVDAADKVESWRFRKQHMAYVVGVDKEGCITDVTRRYASQWSKIIAMRGRMMAHPKGWWAHALRLWDAPGKGERKGAAGDTKEQKKGDWEHVKEAEEKELQGKIDSQPIPSTLSALQNHQVYCDGKRLGRYQGLLPGAKAVGLLKGHRIYCRSDVVELAGSSRWKKMGRQVKASEEDKPVKVIKLKGEKEEGTGKLYGKWQTDLWVPEAVIDGKVPRNEHGNIEFFNHNPAFLPAGTAHVQGDRIGLVATKLGIDYAPALVGFETKAGRQVPVLDGIIVCSEYSQVLQDAHAVWEQQNWERQVKARGLKVRKMWAKLVKGLLLGARLNEEYGGHA